MARTKHTPAPATNRAAIYSRVSTEDQISGNGLDVQLTRCKAQAVVKGWIVEERHVFTDEGISGTKDESERPALAALLATVQAGEIDAVIVLALDRLGRSMKIVLDLVEKITSLKCELVSCNESLDTSTPAGMFVVQMFAALAQLDHANIVKRLKDGRNARYYRDGERGGPLPYGYARSEHGIIIDDKAAPVIRAIFQQRQAGAKLRTIADQLGAQHSGPRGKGWHAGTVKKIIDKESTYKGQRGPGKAPWPRIID